MRRLTIEMLRELGYAVLEADSAARRWRSSTAAPDIVLLFTDVVMPDMNGRQLADEAAHGGRG